MQEFTTCSGSPGSDGLFRVLQDCAYTHTPAGIALAPAEIALAPAESRLHQQKSRLPWQKSRLPQQKLHLPQQKSNLPSKNAVTQAVVAVYLEGSELMEVGCKERGATNGLHEVL